MSDELLYESNHSRVWRVVTSNGPGSVIRKESLGSGAARRARHELQILSRLAGLPGVPQLVTGVTWPDSVVMEDTHGRSLETALHRGPLPVDDLLRLAFDLVRTVAAIHRRGVIHKDISPANILLSEEPFRAALIDFGLSSTFAEERPGFTHHNDIVGTPAYIAPEQTGRTGWPVDQRADLYGLGATLYELATGTPPFGDSDLLRLVHDHLTRVPVPVCELNRQVPTALSAIIDHLLEKEPDRRYQSAEGVLHDLSIVQEAWTHGLIIPFAPGQRDFPWRLAPPSRLVGRDAEISVLTAMFTDAAAGQCRAVFVSGQPGVGKTVLVDELRPRATARDGWFLTAKFDQYRRDAGSDALQQVARGVARMLLAEPESELSTLRARLCEVLGSSAGLLVAAVPELRPVLKVMEASGGDPTNAQVRLRQAGLALLGELAGPRRPIVIVLDDLQWAGPASIAFIDALLAADRLRGVLLVGAYRESEVSADHPLATMLSNWHTLPNRLSHLRLGNLGSDHLRQLLAEMLRMHPTETATLAEVVGARTDGNPFDTVELVNALRRDGALIPGDDGWTWDPVALCRYLGPGDVVDLLAARIAALSEPTRELLEIMACLGNEVELDLLRAAIDQPVSGAPVNAEPAPPTGLHARLTPALEDGLLVMEHGRAAAVRFRHDRVQQAAYGTMSPQARRERHLELARRLATPSSYQIIDEADRHVLAAEQYLSTCDYLTEPGERRRVMGLFLDAAQHNRNLGNYTLVDRYLAAAASLLPPEPRSSRDTALHRRLELERHEALCALGRFDEVDQFYERIQRENDNPLDRAQAAWVQVSSLLNRGEPKQGLDLGLRAIADLGHRVPAPEELGREIERGLDRLTIWARGGTDGEDARRPTNSNSKVGAIAKVINRMIPAAYFCMEPVMPWLVTESARLWEEGGPTAELIGPLAHSAFATIAERQDYATGYAAARRALRAGEQRGFEPFTSQARFLFSVSAAPWFEPLEETVRKAKQAREGLIHGGDTTNACFTHFATAPQLLDCGETLDEHIADVKEGLASARRGGNDVMAGALVAYQQASRALRGTDEADDGGDDAPFDEAAHLAAAPSNSNSAATYHIVRALTAVIFGEMAEADRHLSEAWPAMPFVEATQVVTWAYLLLGLSTADRIRRSAPRDPGELLIQLDKCRGWLARRAAEAPNNFLHMRCLIDAERAWALGDIAGALDAFEQARRAIAPLRRPWQHGLIAERLASLHFARGADDAGRAVLREARRHFQAWGAMAKVEQLEKNYPFLQTDDSPWSTAEARHAVDPRRSANVSSDSVDMLAVLRASQALSSETNLAGLQVRVREVLGALTGASSVQILLRNGGRWLLPQSEATGGVPLGVVEAADRGLLPLAAFRYVERTGEPLFLPDAAGDDRFSRDPYLRTLQGCSLMVVPILIRGEQRAMLMLENQHGRAALRPNRLDTVLLIAGQLSVSLDNAMLYAALEHKVTERTEALRQANERLELLAVTDPLTGLANRRRLTDALETEWRRSLRAHTPIAVAMIDIDHFKLYNDHYGHPAGDECLRKVASVIARTVRETDMPARYGGEEFAVVLPDTDEGVARLVAERIREAVAGLAEPNNRAFHQIVTVSAGVASTMPTRLDRAEQLIKTADSELYRAKRSGRNRVSSGNAR